MDILFFLVIIFILILVSAFFSSSETSMMALNKYKLKNLAQSENKSAKRTLSLLKHPDKLLGTILIGNTFANIAASALLTIIANQLFGDIGVFIATILLTLFILIFAEVLPKTLAALYPQKIALPASGPLKYTSTVLFPLVIGINFCVKILLRPFNISTQKTDNDALNLEEIHTAVLASNKTLSPAFQSLLINVVNLKDATVEDVWVPRQNIIGIDLNQSNQPINSIIQQIIYSPYSKLPLYTDHISNLKGVLYTRDLINLFNTHQNLNNIHIKDLIHLSRKPYFIPEHTDIMTQLSNFQKNHHDMAFIVDEYGEVTGLLTLEDIMEEVVGEFTRKDQPAANDFITQKPDGSYIIEGLMTVKDLKRDLNIDLIDTQYFKNIQNTPKTLSGLIIEYLESIPKINTSVKINQYPIEILAVDDNIIQRARIFPKI